MAQFNLTEEEISTLTQKSLEARKSAYCPYSQFRVGAVLLLTGEPWHVSGGNVENAAYPVGTCAERVALGTAVTSFGVRPASEGGLRIRAVGVATDLKKDKCSPCGMCRQALREFCDLETPVYMHDASGEYEVMTVGQLLPMSFGPSVLPPPDELLKQREQTRGSA